MADAKYRIIPSSAANFNLHTGGDVSPPEDFITLFVKAPFTTQSNMTMTLLSSSFSNSGFFLFRAENRAQPASTLGLASILEVQNAVPDLLGRDRFASVTDADQLSIAAAEKTWIVPSDGWQFVAVPKRAFVQNNSFDFAAVTIIQIDFKNIDAGECCFSDLLLVGGGVDHSGSTPDAQGTTDEASSGLQGTYKYRITYYNSTTGNRSNPSVSTQVAENVNRGSVELTNLPVSPDSQVDKIEIWRTVGGGADFFKIAEIDDTDGSFVDEVADHDSLDSREGVAVMSNLALRFDNAPPEDHFDQHVILRLQAFWISNESGWQGRLMFSPIGRPESFSDFVEVSRVGDPLHRLVVHNGILYVFSESKVYRIDDSADQRTGINYILSRELGGVPGVQFAQRRTVVSTPRGVVWQAPDGVRAFDGARCVLVNPDAIQKVFRGESAENLSAFEGIVATYARNEYYISDGTQTLAVDIEGLGWRDVGFDDLTALFYEYDTDKLVGGRETATQLLEEEGTFDDNGAGIPLEWETPAIDGPNDSVQIVERVFIDMDPNNNTVNSLLINRFDTVTLTQQTGSGRRTFEEDVELMVLKPSMRFSASSTARVTLYDVELEVRDLTMGINVGPNRVEVTGRYREDVSNGQIRFDIKPDQAATALLDQTGRLLVVDRIAIETNTGSEDLVPSLVIHGDTVTLPTINNSARAFVVTEIDRIGQLESVILAGNFTVTGTRPQVFRVELYMRELVLGVNLTSGAERLTVPGRAPTPASGATFEMQPIRQELNQQGTLIWVERVVVEADTDSNDLDLTYTDGLGNAITIGTVNTSSRTYTEFTLETPTPMRALNITSDLTDDIQIFGIEMHVRPVALTIQDRTGGNAVNVKHDGKMITQTSAVVFDVDPFRNETDGERYIPLIETLSLDIDPGGTEITPKIVTELETLFLTSVSNDGRATQVWDINRVGNIQSVELTGDFTSDVALYDVQVQVRSLDLGVNMVEDLG